MTARRRVPIADAAPRAQRRSEVAAHATIRERLDEAAGTAPGPDDEHLAVALAASGERALADEITRRLMPWARARLLDAAVST